jgi:hypothetical protein
VQSTPDPVLAAEGDVACAYGETEACQQQATANLVAAQHPSAVAVLGDSQYESGLLSEYYGAGAYNDTWGPFNPIVHPAPGNHEYAASSAASGYFTYFGSAAANGNYSYELGSWHVVALNSDCSNSGCQDSIAGTTSSAEVSWLQGDLAAHPNQCILAYWHHPRFSSGWVGNSPGVAPLWNTLYAAHADVVLNGHDHLYERFAQQDPSQIPTSEGIREFVAGTGGESLFSMGAIQPNMQAGDNQDFGALFLTLHSGSYDWRFRSVNGIVLDSGSAPCHAKSASSPTATVRTAPAAPRFPPIPTPLLAARSAAMLAVSASPDRARLRFAVQPRPASLRPALGYGVPLDVHCSRACDVSVAVRVRHGHHMITIARYRETETEIPRPSSRVVLHLGRSVVRRLADAPVTLSFVAVDASLEQRTVTRTITLRRH